MLLNPIKETGISTEFNEEIWEVIPDFPRYEVSNLGRVRSNIGMRKYLVSIQATGGYYRVALCKDAESHLMLIHRLVLEAFIGPCPLGHETNHKDGIKSNNRLENLEWVTKGMNQVHAYELGLRDKKGEAHHMAKLKDRDVLEIRRLAKLGMPYPKIASLFSICRANVSCIVTRRTWSHV